MTNINALLVQGLDTEAVELLVSRINEVGEICQLAVDIVDGMDAGHPEYPYYEGYATALADFGTFLIYGDRPSLPGS